MELFKLLGTVAIENSGAINALDETTNKAEKSESKLSKVFKKIGTAVAAGFAIDKIKDFGLACVEAAANLQATNSQFSQVFGDLEETASESLSNIAAQAGIAENRMKGSYTKIAAFAKTTGLETKDALSLADRAMIAVADSAAFYDRTLEETTESLQSFLKGNYENDAALGLSCTETTRNAAANELYGKSFQELSEAQKQLTLLKMVEDANALSGALGQASRESDTWTNQTGNLKQAWTDLQSTLGASILPVVTRFVGALAEKLGATTEKVGEFLAKISDAEVVAGAFKNTLTAIFGEETVASILGLFQTIQDNAAPFYETMQSGFQVLWDVCLTVWETIGQPIWDMISGAIGKTADLFAKNMPAILGFFQKAIAGIKDTWENHLKPVFELIGTFLETILKPIFEVVFDAILGYVKFAFEQIGAIWTDVLKPVFDGICDFIVNIFSGNWKGAWEGIVNTFDTVFGNLVNIAKRPINEVIKLVNKMIDAINSVSFDIPEWVPGLGGQSFGFNLSHVPLLAKGGVLEKGQVGLLEGSGAEAVVPLENNTEWITKVAHQFNGVPGNNAVLEKILDVLLEIRNALPEELADAVAQLKFEISNREFARLVKAVN